VPNDNSELLDSFLAAQQSEGRYFDTASFTIDSVKALHKLSLHQLPDSGLWLVKLVQAAVASGADSVAVTFERKKVTARFLPRQAWQADEVLEVVLSGALPQDRALMHLVTAIRGSSASISEAVAWSCGAARVELGQGSCQVVAQPEQSEFQLVATRPARSRSLSKTLASSVTDLVKQTVEEHDALRGHCWVCPIPITIDGCALPRGYDVMNAGRVEKSPWRVLRSYNKNEGAVVQAGLGVGPLHDPSLGPELPYLTTFAGDAGTNPVILQKPVFMGQTFLWRRPEGPVHGAVALMSGPKETESRLHFVLDGAVVATHPLPSWDVKLTTVLGIPVSRRSFALRAIVAVEPAALDLSQFAVRDADLARLLPLIVPDVEALIDRLFQHMSELYYLPLTRKIAPLAGVGLGAEVVVLGVVSQGVMLLPMAGMVAVAGAINTAIWRSKMRNAVRSMLEAVQATERPAPV
jgi:hypothetical protein